MSLAIIFWGGCGLFAAGIIMGYLIGTEVWNDNSKMS